MSERGLRRALEAVELPGEHEARERAWRVLHAAWAAREPQPRSRPFLRPALVLGAVLAVVAAALTPPGRALVEQVREAIGVERAAPALFSLPAEGRLLVTSERGVWVVRPDGSKRLLGRYREAAWSPRGLFVVAARRNELAALDPRTGVIRWSLPRPDVRHPRWGGSRRDTRIAYLSGPTLRVVAGDGTGDRLLARRTPPIAPAWRPGDEHVLAYAAAADELVVVEVDSRARRFARRVPGLLQLLWSSDGKLLVVRTRTGIHVYLASGRRAGGFATERLPTGRSPLVAAALAPNGRELAYAVYRSGLDRTVVRADRLAPQPVDTPLLFSGEGRITDLSWSPDGRWLLLAWRDADQWVFLRSTGLRNVDAVSSISAQFRSGSFPRVEGWCCAPR